MVFSFKCSFKSVLMLLVCSVLWAGGIKSVMATSYVAMSSAITIDHSALYPHKPSYYRHEHHHHTKHHKKHNSHSRDPWHWGANWDSRWNKSVGIGWSSNFYDPWRWNTWDKRHWNGRYMYSQRYPRATPVITPIKITPKAPPLQSRTTHMAYDSGLHSLPANAKVVMRNNKPYYLWQGVTYQYDWSKERYMIVDKKVNESIKTQ